MEQHVDERRFRRAKFNFVWYTVLFCIFGLFLCVGTLYLLFGIHLAFDSLLHDCVRAMEFTWYLCLLSLILTLLLFSLYLRQQEVHSNQLLKKQLGVFNALLLTFIQGTLGVFSSDPEFLCYGTDGQNGLELVFNGWCALPLLLLVSYYYNTWGIVVEFS